MENTTNRISRNVNKDMNNGINESINEGANKVTNKKVIEYTILFVVLGIAVVWTLVNCTSTAFFCDEAFSIRLCRENIPTLIQLTAEDVHPPLYYIWLKIVYRIVGLNAFSFRLASAIPYIALMVWITFWLKKDMGFQIALLFDALYLTMMSTFEYSSIARMYTLALLFFTVCFYEGYHLLKNGASGKKSIFHWTLFTLGAIGASYCHYYAFAMCLLLYFFIFCVLIYRNPKTWKKCVICAIVSLLAYLPWLFVFITTMKKVAGDYWMTNIPTIRDCISYIFGKGILGVLLFVIYIASFASLVIGEWREIREHQREKMSNECIISVIGFLVITIMMLFAIGYSNLVRPVFKTSYLLPAIVAVWIGYALSFARLIRNRKSLVGVLIILLIISGIPREIAIYQRGQVWDVGTKQVVAYMEEHLSAENLLIAHQSELTAELFRYYFQDNRHNVLEEKDWGELEQTDKMFYFSIDDALDQETNQKITDIGYEITGETNGYLGNIRVYVYELIRK